MHVFLHRLDPLFFLPQCLLDPYFAILDIPKNVTGIVCLPKQIILESVYLQRNQAIQIQHTQRNMNTKGYRSSGAYRYELMSLSMLKLLKSIRDYVEYLYIFGP